METQEVINKALSYAADQAEKHPESYGWAELAECFGEEDMGYFLELDEAKKSWDQVVAVLNDHVKIRSELQADVKATCW